MAIHDQTNFRVCPACIRFPCQCNRNVPVTFTASTEEWEKRLAELEKELERLVTELEAQQRGCDD